MAEDKATLEQIMDDVPPPVLRGGTESTESACKNMKQTAKILEMHNALGERQEGKKLQARLIGLLTHECSITEATFILMASFLLAALLGVVRQVLFNMHFGTGMEANAFYAAVRLPDMLFALIAGDALASAMIPILLGVAREGNVVEQRFTNLVLTTLLVVFAVIIIISEIFTPAFVNYILAPGFDAETSSLTISLIRIMLLQPMILAIGSVAVALLNSRNQFLLTALSFASHQLAMIIGIAAAWIYPPLGIYGAALGVILGGVLQLLILLPGLMARRFQYRPAWNLHDQHLRDIIRLLIPSGMAVGVGYIGIIMETAFVSKVSELAGLAALSNAFMLLALPVSLIGQAVAQAAFPRLAAQVAAYDWLRMRRTLLQALVAVFGLAFLALLGTIILGRPVIRILFEHGKFDTDAGSLTYVMLVPYMLGLPAYVATEVLTRGLTAFRDTLTPFVTNSLRLGGRIVIIALLLPSSGIVAIPIAFAVTAFGEMLVLGIVLWRKIQLQIHARFAVTAWGAID